MQSLDFYIAAQQRVLADVQAHCKVHCLNRYYAIQASQDDISKEQDMTKIFHTQVPQDETVNNTIADVFNVAAIALTGVLGLLTVAATI
jgi:hypothetical protein